MTKEDAYCEYEWYLRLLLTFTENGHGECDMADALRESMDEPWRLMDDTQRRQMIALITTLEKEYVKETS